jgi:hypothetical protein
MLPYPSSVTRPVVKMLALAVGSVALALPVLSATSEAAAPAATRPRAAPQPWTLAPSADTGGAILVDASGQGYVAWDITGTGGAADQVYFCKLAKGQNCTKRIHLPLPSSESNYGISQPFPVFGVKAGEVEVVGPSYVYGNTVIWTSTNGGTSFGAGYVTPAGTFSDSTSVGDVLRDPASTSTSGTYMDTAGWNPDLGYSFTSAKIVACTSCNQQLSDGGGTLGATLGDSGQAQVVVYWRDTAVPELGYFWSAQSAGTPWHGPYKLGNGIDARLADGPGGLYLLSQDYTSQSEKNPSRLDVRKWNATTHTFGSATLVVNDSATSLSNSYGGLAEDPANGHLYVAWPGHVSAEGGFVMRLWESTNGGASFTGPKYPSLLGSAFSGPVRIAVRGGFGFLTFLETGGLKLVPIS